MHLVAHHSEPIAHHPLRMTSLTGARFVDYRIELKELSLLGSCHAKPRQQRELSHQPPRVGRNNWRPPLRLLVVSISNSLSSLLEPPQGPKHTWTCYDAHSGGNGSLPPSSEDAWRPFHLALCLDKVGGGTPADSLLLRTQTLTSRYLLVDHDPPKPPLAYQL